MRILGIVCVVSALTSCATVQEPSCGVSPSIFCEPFKVMASEMPESEQKKLLALTPQERALLHFSLGMGVRNRFGLWHDNELTRYFRSQGVGHPDEMSSPFIAGFVEFVRGKPVDMAKIIPAYVAPPPPPPPPEHE